MKVKVFYEAVRTMEIDLNEKYRPLCEKHEEDYTDAEENIINEMIDSIDSYIKQIDPNFEESTGMIGIDVNIDWDW